MSGMYVRAVDTVRPGLGAVDAGTVASTVGGSTATGATIGTAVLPGIGTAVGAVLGSIVGLFGGGAKRDREREQVIDNLVAAAATNAAAFTALEFFAWEGRRGLPGDIRPPVSDGSRSPPKQRAYAAKKAAMLVGSGQYRFSKPEYYGYAKLSPTVDYGAVSPSTGGLAPSPVTTGTGTVQAGMLGGNAAAVVIGIGVLVGMALSGRKGARR